MTASLFATYKSAIERDLQAGNATEHTHRPTLKTLLETLGSGVTATNDPKRVACGAPDYVVSRRTRHGPLTLGYVETKDIGVSLDGAEGSDQLRRYLSALGNLILTDYLEFRWFVAGERRLTARLATPGTRGRLVPEKDGAEAVEELLRGFLGHRAEPVRRPKELAERMARLTHLIRDMIVAAFEARSASGNLLDLHKAFADVLIPDLLVSQFADMFAQTLAYGLFAARCNHQGASPFQRLGAAGEIPKTNPFLRRLFATITGPDLDDEPFAGFVDDLAQLLAETDMATVLADFGKRTRQEDPVVHFYETFLGAYDPKLRKVRGVYYTAEPVVSYIVRSVNHLLRTRFECPAGLADTATVPYTRTDEQGKVHTERAPRVLILDPACGTGTFLYAMVDLIREEHRRQGKAGEWSGYVRDHLLSRLFGFELLVAPYAVAHLKLGMQLAALDLPEAERRDWAYDFAGTERLGVYLTNSLEEAVKRSELLMGAYISEEANAAVQIKRELPIMVVLGNPPYSGHSANRSWVAVTEQRGKPDALRYVVVRQKTFIGRLLQDYYQVDGQPLGERNPKWLQDDYVKFLRFGQWRIERSGAGVLAFITNHGYLDNPTFRGMRQQLMRAFTDIYILDMHGNTKKRERPPDGGLDENVFDIQQGVAIGIFVKEPGEPGPAKVHHRHLWGGRENKYAWLADHGIETTAWTQLAPQSRFYLFVPQDTDLRAEYERGWRITDSMPGNSVGIVTSRDAFVFDFDEPQLRARITDFLNPAHSDEEVRTRYFGSQGRAGYLAGDNRDWRIADKRKAIQHDLAWRQAFVRCLYRPFDIRPLFYHDDAIDFGRREVMGNMLAGVNVGLVTTRSVEIGRGYEHVFCTRNVIQHHTVSLKEVNYLFPLYLYPGTPLDEHGPGPGGRRPNVARALIAAMTSSLGLTFVPDGTGNLLTTFGPEDVFHYVYAIFHSATYRSRYTEFLKTDFPRIPVTSDREQFRALATRGAALVAVHLMESPVLTRPITQYPVPGSNTVEPGYPRYFAPGEPEPGTKRPLKAGRVYISGDGHKTGKRAQYFESVPPDVWAFHIGGYQVCEKWLKDRRNRPLSYEDLTHYQKIVVALSETIRLMGEIDEAIPSWPIR